MPVVVHADAVPDPGTVMVESGGAAITYATVLGSQGFAGHAGDAKCLSVESAGTGEVFDDLNGARVGKSCL